MKKVFTDISHIAHLWANKLQDEASNGRFGNFYFNGDTIYSYGSHFPIAKHVLNESDDKGTLFTKRGYSVTTSKQIGVVSSASNHLNIIKCWNPDNSHADNFKKWLDIIEEIGDKLKNARKPEIYLNQITNEYAEVVKYATFFGLTIPETLQLAGNIQDKAEFEAFKGKMADAEKALNARIKKETDLKIKKDLAKWRKFEFPRISTRANEDYIRYNTAKERLETSQNVEIPLTIAKSFYERIQAVIASGGCIECEYKILNYQVKSINKEGVTVGCHFITMKEINLTAKKLNWI